MAYRRRLKNKKPPEGWELIEEVVEDFELQVGQGSMHILHHATTIGCFVSCARVCSRSCMCRRLLCFVVRRLASHRCVRCHQHLLGPAALLRSRALIPDPKPKPSQPFRSGAEQMKEAVNEEHEGRRKNELTWKINRIHWEKNRFIYDLMYQRKVRAFSTAMHQVPTFIPRPLLEC